MSNKIGISLSIDVTKIDKSKLHKGKKGTYLDATFFFTPDEVDQYGNSGMITQSVSKEDKEAGVKGAILGNGKKFWSSDNQQQKPQSQPTNTPDDSFDDTDLPF